MTKTRTTLTVMLLFAMVFSISNLAFARTIAVQNKGESELVNANNQFTIDIYSELAEEEGNIFFSPYSIFTALGMTYAGARGETEAEMHDVLNFPFEGEELYKSFKDLIAGLNERGGGENYTLRVANRIWGQSGYKFRDEFLKILKDYFEAPLETADFGSNPDGERKRINDWVEDQTNDKIKDLLQKNDINPTTTMVLVNAIYFLGNWQDQFDAEFTRKHDFILEDGSKISHPLMFRSDHYGYYKGDDFSAIQIDYKNRELSMIVLLPSEHNGLKTLEEKLDKDLVSEVFNGLRSEKVKLFLPKFKMTSKFELGDIMKKMGMKTAFGMAADFTGMSDMGGLFISKIIHKAFVDVNEKGTEAAAATAVVMGRSMHTEEKIFRADHPFLFMIRDNNSGSILFMGRLEKPAPYPADSGDEDKDSKNSSAGDDEKKTDFDPVEGFRNYVRELFEK